MASFKDAAGREWSIKLTIGKAARLKDATGLDFVAALYDSENAYRIIGELYKDLARFMNVVHLAAAVDVPLADFMDAMEGEQVAEAFEALDTAFTDFYPPGKRERIARVKQEMKAGMEAEQASIMDEINGKVETEIRAAVREMAGPILTPGK